MIRQFFANLVGIGSATQVDDSGEMQLVQVTEGAQGKGFAARVTDKVRRVTEFGFASVPPLGSEVMVIRRGGDRSHSVVIATSHRQSRLKNLGPGDVAVYDVRGAYVKFTSSGIVVDGAGQTVTIQNCGHVQVNGDLQVTGDVVSRSGGSAVSLNGVRDAYVAHHHTGVTTGAGVSGPSDHIAV